MAEATLRLVYDDLRERQEHLLTEYEAKEINRDDEDSYYDEDEDYDYWNEEDEGPPVQLVDFEEQVARDLDLLEHDFVDLDPVSDDLLIRPAGILPLVALVTDALVRYDYDAEHVLIYMFNLLGVFD